MTEFKTFVQNKKSGAYLSILLYAVVVFDQVYSFSLYRRNQFDKIFFLIYIHLALAHERNA